MHKPRLGTRGSPLALIQAHAVAAALGGAVEIVVIKTTGDMMQDRPLAAIGGKALWTKEIDRALIEGNIDFAVHSAKDIESIRPAAIAFVATLPRADPSERLIGIDRLAALRPGLCVGTTSPRRAAQLLRRCPGLVLVPFRGNVATRIERIANGEADATLLASAGLLRLGLNAVGSPVSVDDLLPAPGQGAIGIECRTGDDRMTALLAAISDAATLTAVIAERSLAAALGGSCHSPVAALAVPAGGGLALRAEILSADGSECIADSMTFASDAAVQAGRDLAALLLSRASPALKRTFGGN